MRGRGRREGGGEEERGRRGEGVWEEAKGERGESEEEGGG